MKMLKSLLKYVLYAVVLAVLFIDIWRMVSRFLFNNELPFLFGYSHVTVLSGSMEPAFSTGDMLIIHRENEYRTGDVITFWESGNLVTHRIIEKKPDGDEVITKGDFNNVPDNSPVGITRIAGRVVWVIPGLGKFILFIRTPFGLLLVMAAGAMALFLPDWISNLKDQEGR